MNTCRCCGRPSRTGLPAGLMRVDGGDMHPDCWDEHHSDPFGPWPRSHECARPRDDAETGANSLSEIDIDAIVTATLEGCRTADTYLDDLNTLHGRGAAVSVLMKLWRAGPPIGRELVDLLLEYEPESLRRVSAEIEKRMSKYEAEGVLGEDHRNL